MSDYRCYRINGRALRADANLSVEDVRFLVANGIAPVTPVRAERRAA